MRLFDSHAHLTDKRFGDDLPDVLVRARDSGVEGIVSIASDLEDAERAIGLAARHPGFVHATAGIHPHEAAEAPRDALHRVRELARGEGRSTVVAIGETGLDFHYDHSPRAIQRELFIGHLGIAEELGLPVVVHSRSAVEDTITILREHGTGVRGVLHCFTGDPELLAAALDVGWWVSFTGIVTFRNWTADDAVRGVPADRFMVETDAPWLAPVPHRGRRNEPAFVAPILEAVALARGDDPSELAERTTRNALRFFELDRAG